MGGTFFQYGTAAHLALLTAAPLFLYAVCGTSVHAMALFSLSLLAALWVVMNPSPHMGELPRDARHRIGWELLRDPFLTLSVIALVLSIVRAVNGGISVDYDVASGIWHLNGPAVSVLPGSVTGHGVVPLAGFLALSIATLGARHALGTHARFYYVLLSGVLAAVAVVGWWGLSAHGFSIQGLAPSADGSLSLGTLLGVYFLFAVASWVGSWSLDSILSELVAAASVSILLAGLLATSSTFALLIFVVLGLLLIAVGTVFSVNRRAPTAWFRTGLALILVLLPIGGVALGFMGRPPLWPMFQEGFLSLREATISVAIAAWRESSQLGVGLGAYPLALGFHATPEDWQVVSVSQTAAPCGWVHFLFERGFLGSAVLLAGLVILLRDVILRYIRSGLVWPCAALHLLGLFVLIGVSVLLFFDSSFAQLNALIPVGAALALTAAALPNSKES